MQGPDLGDVRCEGCDAGARGFDAGKEVFLSEDRGTGGAVVGEPVVRFRVVGASGVG